jgi:hypothetical protein
MKKPTKAEVNARIEEILRIRLDGAELWDIREYVREMEGKEGSPWKSDKPLSDSQLYRYIARTDRLIAESCRSSRKRLMRRHLAQRRNLFAKAVNTGDLRTALAVAADEARLLRLYDDPPTKPPKGDLPTSPTAVVTILAARLASIDQATLPAGEHARLTAAVADALLRAVGVADLESQLSEIMERLDRLTADRGAGR